MRGIFLLLLVILPASSHAQFFQVTHVTGSPTVHCEPGMDSSDAKTDSGVSERILGEGDKLDTDAIVDVGASEILVLQTPSGETFSLRGIYSFSLKTLARGRGIPRARRIYMPMTPARTTGVRGDELDAEAPSPVDAAQSHAATPRALRNALVTAVQLGDATAFLKCFSPETLEDPVFGPFLEVAARVIVLPDSITARMIEKRAINIPAHLRTIKQSVLNFLAMWLEAVPSSNQESFCSYAFIEEARSSIYGEIGSMLWTGASYNYYRRAALRESIDDREEERQTPVMSQQEMDELISNSGIGENVWGLPYRVTIEGDSYILESPEFVWELPPESSTPDMTSETFTAVGKRTWDTIGKLVNLRRRIKVFEELRELDDRILLFREIEGRIPRTYDWWRCASSWIWRQERIISISSSSTEQNGFPIPSIHRILRTASALSIL